MLGTAVSCKQEQVKITVSSLLSYQLWWGNPCAGSECHTEACYAISGEDEGCPVTCDKAKLFALVKILKETGTQLFGFCKRERSELRHLQQFVVAQK